MLRPQIGAVVILINDHNQDLIIMWIYRAGSSITAEPKEQKRDGCKDLNRCVSLFSLSLLYEGKMGCKTDIIQKT